MYCLGILLLFTVNNVVYKRNKYDQSVRVMDIYIVKKFFYYVLFRF